MRRLCSNVFPFRFCLLSTSLLVVRSLHSLAACVATGVKKWEEQQQLSAHVVAQMAQVAQTAAEVDREPESKSASSSSSSSSSSGEEPCLLLLPCLKRTAAARGECVECFRLVALCSPVLSVCQPFFCSDAAVNELATAIVSHSSVPPSLQRYLVPSGQPVCFALSFWRNSSFVHPLRMLNENAKFIDLSLFVHCFETAGLAFHSPLTDLGFRRLSDALCDMQQQQKASD